MNAPPIDRLPTGDLARGLSVVRRGRVPVLCWEGDDTWIVTRPKSAGEASALMALQRHRGIHVVRFNAVDAEEVVTHRRRQQPPRCENRACRDFGGCHWHDGDVPRYFPREGES